MGMKPRFTTTPAGWQLAVILWERMTDAQIEHQLHCAASELTRRRLAKERKED